jgi:23S rRNA (adenine2503-C2)-methyltransferase
MKQLKEKTFANGAVYALATAKGNLIETTDTFLPYETINAIGRRTNKLISCENVGSRSERWMIGISTMSGCPVRCRFCATANMKRVALLSAREMVDQVRFILKKNPACRPSVAREFKVLFTRMGEPALNGDAVLEAIRMLKKEYPNISVSVSTIGIRNDFLQKLLTLRDAYEDDFIQLQFSVHSTSEKDRDWLQPAKNKMDFKDINEFAKTWVRGGRRKITLNFTITDKKEGADIHRNEFDVEKLSHSFDKALFFIKLSPLNANMVSDANDLVGVIQEKNII